MAAYQFCPSCGSRLPESGVVRFCPSCGAAQPQESGLIDKWLKTPVATLNDAAACCEQFVAAQKEQGLSADEIRGQAADLFRQLKARLPQRPVRLRAAVPKQVFATDGDRVSIVLKSCQDKERLAGKLTGVLRRGATAIRMAVDMAPCVILYKSKAEEAQAAIAVLEAEGSAYAAFSGDFDADAPLEQYIRAFSSLDQEVQELLAAAPRVLWLGDQIRAVIPDVELEHELGTLVISDGNIFFLRRSCKDSKEIGHVISCSQIAEVVEHPDPSGGMLELMYRQFGQEDVFRFSDESALRAAWEEISRIIKQ